LVLPSVVCATAAVREAAQSIPQAVFFEHPIGCAQIGSDRDQTLRTLVGVGAHPNVRDTVVIGLGCEGVPAQEVYQAIMERQHTAHVITIQAAGGTEAAAQQAIADLTPDLSDSTPRQSVIVDHLILGVGTIDGWGAEGRHLIEACLDRGMRVIEGTVGGPQVLPYGSAMPVDVRHAAMEAPVGDSALITGLAAAGAHNIIAQADLHHLGGHPIVPVIRLGYQEKQRSALVDDMDGMFEDRTPDAWVDWILEVASGVQTMVETMHTETFAIERIGPTL
jgi:altronate dehydratase large subunit